MVQLKTVSSYEAFFINNSSILNDAKVNGACFQIFVGLKLYLQTASFKLSTNTSELSRCFMKSPLRGGVITLPHSGSHTQSGALTTPLILKRLLSLRKLYSYPAINLICNVNMNSQPIFIYGLFTGTHILTTDKNCS